MANPFHARATARLLPLALLCVLGSPSSAAERAARPAPSFTLPSADATVSLDSLRGKVVLVDFWASWCGPCRRSFPWMAAMQAKYADQGLVVVAINLDKTREAAAAFLAEVPSPFRVLFDPAAKTAAAYRVQGMPTTVLVGRDGTIRHTHIGFEPAKAAAFEKLIQEALRP